MDNTALYISACVGVVMLVFNVWLLDRWLSHLSAVERRLAEIVALSERSTAALEKLAA